VLYDRDIKGIERHKFVEFSRIEKYAHEKGYFVEDNEVISPAGKVLKPKLSSNGYPSIQVWKDGKRYRSRIHRLVAYQKYGEEIYTPGTEVRHLDGSRNNFSKENIIIGTKSENMLDRSKLLRKRIGKIAGKAAREAHRKLLDNEVLEIRRKLLEGQTQTYLMKEYGVSQGIISDIKLRKTYAHLDGKPLDLVADRKRNEAARIKIVRETNRKLSDEAVLKIRVKLSKGVLQKTLAKEYGVCTQTISNVKHRKTFAHLD